MASNELEAQLLEIGNQLLEPPSTVEELLPLLDRIERCLTKVGQSPNKSMQAALSPSQKALVAEQLLRHSDPHVKVSVASCITEITRITAPDAPYDDDPMKEAFQLIVSTFENLQNKPSRSYTKTTYILETVARVRSCDLMLDLECDELIVEMFQHFLKAIRGYHPVSVISSMENIITLVIEECEDVSCQLLAPLLASVKNVEEEVETHGIALADYSKVVASICSESAGDTEKNGVHDDKDMGGYNLRGRKKKDVDLNMFDRISGLPDEILTSILSLLPLREAQATRILSRRWQHVWPYCTTLNFNAGRQLITFGKLQFDWERELVLRMYVDWVDSVLKQHKAPNIERFRVAFGHGPRSCIDDWIQFAMRKGVQILEMDLSAILHPRGLHYKLSNKVLGIREFSSFKALCSEYIGFKFLKVLDFNCVDVDQGILEYFIYNCPVLERVAVCDSSLLVNLRVVGQSIALKYLTIHRCRNLKSVEICEANLVSFTYGGELEKLLLRNLPLLVEVSLSEWK
ncbi:PREDICTED: uncharacterized protein LOC101294407 [Fragaria vesca subsp. vesca]